MAILFNVARFSVFCKFSSLLFAIEEDQPSSGNVPKRHVPIKTVNTTGIKMDELSKISTKYLHLGRVRQVDSSRSCIYSR